MKELRFTVGRGVWRIAFAFDVHRKAIILVASEKSQGKHRRFNRGLIGRADQRFASHLDWLSRESDQMTNLNHRMSELPPSRLEKVTDRAAALISEEMSPRDLRKARSPTQVTMAETLGINQENVSRIEQRTDLLLSTLRNVVEAMGGRLNLMVEFPDRPPATIAGLSSLGYEEVAKGT